MDELERYLQCFDEKDRVLVRVITKYAHQEIENIQYILLTYAYALDDTKSLRLLLNMGCGRTTKSCGSVTQDRRFDERMRLFFDNGINHYKIRPSDQPKLQQFLHSRDCARKAAIVVMGAAKGTFGGKDVGRIIGRVIWASRGIYSD